MFAQATCYASKIDFSCSYNKNARIENGQSTEKSSTLEELLSGNIAELPEIVEALQSQTNAGAAIEPSMNRFSQKDIMRGRGKSLNRYVYCINDSVNLIDPSGKVSVLTAAAAAAVGAASAIAASTAVKAVANSAKKVKSMRRHRQRYSEKTGGKQHIGEQGASYQLVKHYNFRGKLEVGYARKSVSASYV